MHQKGKARLRRAALSGDRSYFYNDDYSIDVHFDENNFLYLELRRMHFKCLNLNYFRIV